MKSLSRHQKVRTDLVSSATWYNREQPGVGQRFIDEVQFTYEKIRERPTSWPSRGKGIRYCPVKDFPFNVVYTERPNTIWIVAVAHRSRRPDYWQMRLKDIPS
ncbi:MAG: type II toxin-antitoxin system RelE/ParE family toxin [Planctomycetota bacterium]